MKEIILRIETKNDEKRYFQIVNGTKSYLTRQQYYNKIQ